jgi:hypothetical protein
MSVPNDICFFWYTYSPYARKIQWYLTLRGLGYAQCVCHRESHSMHSNKLSRPKEENKDLQMVDATADHATARS